jgi:hypothetical protein
MNVKKGATLQKITALAIGTRVIAKLKRPLWAAMRNPMITVSLILSEGNSRGFLLISDMPTRRNIAAHDRA